MKNLKAFQKMTVKMGLGLTVALSAGIGMLAVPASSFAASATSTSIADNVLSTAKQYMGVPYQFGATTGDTSSFDCSSFTKYVFKQNGISIPRSSAQQSQVGIAVSRDQLQPGDLIFFYNPIHHVAIYMGNGQIIHTWGAGGVRIDSLNSSWWSSHYTSARRVIPNNGQAVAAPSSQVTPSNRNVQPTQDAPSSYNSVKPVRSIHTKPVKTKRHFNRYRQTYRFNDQQQSDGYDYYEDHDGYNQKGDFEE